MLFRIVLDLLLIIGSIAAVVAMLAGVGLLLRRAVTRLPLDLDACFLAAWIGFGAVITVLTCWHLVLPVGSAALATIAATGAVGLVVNREALWQLRRTETWRPGAGTLVLLGLVTLWVAIRALTLPNAWDDGLYHMQAVKWAQAFAVVPGLANLHGPLGFNMPSFLYDAMIDSGPWAGVGTHLANPALLWLLIVQAICAAGRVVRPAAQPERVYESVMVAAPLVLGVRESLSGYSTDLPVLCLLLVTGLVLYRLLTALERGSAEHERLQMFVLAVLVAASVQVKLSSAVCAGLSLLVAVTIRWRVWTTTERRQILGIIGAVALVCGIPWAIRAVVLSGYPLFPIPVAGFPVDWRVPLEHARVEAAYIGFTERGFSWRLVGSGWVTLVLTREVYSVLMPCFIAAVAAVPAVFGSGRARSLRPGWWAAVPLLLSLVAWLLSAPSTRYGLALFWSLTALCVAEWFRAAGDRVSPTRLARARLAVQVLALAGPVIEPAVAAAFTNARVVAAVGAQLAPLAGGPHGFRSTPPVSPLEPFVTSTGLTVQVPVRDRVEKTKCWSSPILCTSNPAPNLRLRVPGDIASGFAVDGEWQMQDWPYYWQSAYLPEWRRRYGAARRRAEEESKP